MSRSRTLLAALAVLLGACAPAVSPAPALAPDRSLVDDVAAARVRLDVERAAARALRDPAERAARLVDLGLWPAADSVIAGARPTARVRLAGAELDLRRHRYARARAAVDAVLAADPRNREARLLLARLEVQAWRLAAARAIAEAVLGAERRSEEAALLLGRIRLLEKDYPAALEWAVRVQEWNPANAGAYLLEADVRFWDQDPAGAEAPLAHALELDPFDPDARFAWGYAIWRRVDATQLDAMADQWNLALEVDPLHYVTHWHWGNGHTNLTYAEYAQPEDSTVRARLAPADSLIARGRVEDAIAMARDVGRDFPGSVLPDMLRGSAFYMASSLDRGERLDSAAAIFRDVLARKRNYGAAHNGLAAVIKQRQFPVLAAYDSLEAAIAATPLPPDPVLDSVFPDLRYYPGDRVAKMVRQELGPSAAYLPMLARQGRSFRIPALHQDLAQAMGDTYFRTATTFDNRQWMDIRGVGSGAAGIEYVERGAHLERKVLLHEFTHLVHGNVYTDAESRRVRDLYHRAMAEDRTLDYYASNNESEFLAQAYPAYLSPLKVHPLNHKSMNTAGDLRAKDPATFAFVDSLVQRQRRYLEGDSTALASNWAQVYVNLSERARRGGDGNGDARLARAEALLDTALVWDVRYVPAMLSYAALLRDAGRFGAAQEWLARAESLDPEYAPTWAARAQLVAAVARAEPSDPGAELEAQARLYRRALALETDLAARAALNGTLRRLYRGYGRVPDAIAVAEEYILDAPTVSTYLRDRRDEAVAFIAELRAAAGYASGSVDTLRGLVRRKPQDYTLRAQLADALVAAGETEEAVSMLEEAQRILTAGGAPSAGFAARLAEIHLARGDTAAAEAALQPVLDGRARPAGAETRLARALVAIGQNTEANVQLERLPEPTSPAARAELEYTRASLAEWRGDDEVAEAGYRAAVGSDPYHAEARLRLMALLRRRGRADEADAVVAAARRLALPPGPALERRLTRAADPAP